MAIFKIAYVTRDGMSHSTKIEAFNQAYAEIIFRREYPNVAIKLFKKMPAAAK